MLALDTPNRRVTALQLRDAAEEYINPDHKIEYHHDEMMALFAAHDLDVMRAVGLNNVKASLDADHFDLDDLITSELLSDDVEDCYCLAYLVRPAPR